MSWRPRSSTARSGLAVRVIVDGTWGFASHAELDADVAAETARRAVAVATHAGAAERRDASSWRPSRCTPTSAGCPTTGSTRSRPGAPTRSALLAEYSGRLLAADGVDHVSASLHAVKEQTFYADTFGLVDHPAAGAGAADARGRRRRRRGGHLRDHAHAGAADGAGLGGRRRRRRVGLDRRAGRAADAAGREGQGAERRRRPDRPGDRPVQPVADHPRIHRPRHRIRPRDRLRGRLRGHVVRHAGQAGHACGTARR